MKRVPSFSHRPGFPKGLQVRVALQNSQAFGCLASSSVVKSSRTQVVLVESDAKARRQAEGQLEALSYVGMHAYSRLVTS